MLNRKILAKLTAHAPKPKSSDHHWEQGGLARKRPQLALHGGYATAVKAKQGSRVQLRIEGIVTGVESSPRQKPNMVIQVEKVSQS